MVYVLLLIFILVTAIPWFVRTSPKILHPLNVFVIIQLLLIVPGVVVAVGDSTAMDSRIVRAAGTDFDAAMSWTLLLLTLMNLCIYAAFYFWRARKPVPPVHYAPLREQAYDSYIYIAVLMGLMVGTFILKAQFAGGFDFLLNNLNERAELLRGAGPFQVVESGARMLGVYIATRVALIRQNSFAWISLAGVVTLSFMVGGLFGSRKSAIDSLILMLMTVSFFRARFFLASPTNIVGVLGGYLFILAILYLGLMYRNSGDQVDWSSALTASAFEIKKMLVTNSYIGTYYFITNIYNEGNYYYWSLLGDLKTSLFPSFLFPEKAITDDGVYVKYAVQGIFLEAQRPGWTVVSDSLPPETLGYAYMNGGPLAVPVFGLALGSVFAFILARAERHPHAPIAVILAIWVFNSFEFSNLRLTQLATLALALFTVRILLKPVEVSTRLRLWSV